MKIVRLTEADLTNIVKRVIKENEQQAMLQQITDDANQEIQDLGEDPLSTEDVNDLIGCEMDDESEVPQEHISVFRKLKIAISKANREQLKDAFRQIKAAKNNQKQIGEQAEAATALILGVPVLNAVLIVIGGLLLISILGRLIKNLINNEREYVPSCRQGIRAVRNRRSY